MRLLTEFWVGGKPVPWSMPGIELERPPGGGKPRVAFKGKPPALTAWEGHVADAGRIAMAGEPPYIGPDPVRVELDFYRVTPPGKRDGDHWNVAVELKESTGKPVKRGGPVADLTNLLKGAEDGLAGVVFGDDVQVCEQGNRRLYGPREGVMVRVYALDSGESTQLERWGFDHFTTTTVDDSTATPLTETPILSA